MRIVSTAVLLGALCLAGCDDNGSNFVFTTPLAGTFVLQTVNGGTLPVIIVDSISPALRVEVLSGQIVINTDNTFTDVIAFQQTLAGVVTTQTIACSGIVTTTGNTTTLVQTVVAPNCGATLPVVLNGNSLTVLIQPGVQGVFVR